MHPRFIFFPYLVCFLCFVLSVIPLLLGLSLLYSTVLSIHFRQVIISTLPSLLSCPLSLYFSATFPLVASFVFFPSFLFQFFHFSYAVVSSLLSLPLLLSSEAVRLLFCSMKSSQPGPSAWLCTAPLIGSRETAPVEHDVLDWNSPQSNKITHTYSPISKLQTLYPLISSLIIHPS